MIPVIGIPYISNPDLLRRLLETIPDDLYEVIHIIDNSSNGIAADLVKPRTIITRMHHNLGVGAAWNLVMKLHPKARWWAHFNADIEVDRDVLERLISAMKMNAITYIGSMAAFGIRTDCIQTVGWFDENYVPGYCEDIDFDYRCRLMGVHIENVGAMPVHHGSATIKNSQHYRTENNRSYPANRRYYEQKWGGFVGEETYTTPFDRGGSPRDWTLDMTRLQNLSWTKE